MKGTGLDLTRHGVLNRVFAPLGVEIGTLPLLPKDSVRFVRPASTGILPPEGGTAPVPVRIMEDAFRIGGLVFGASGVGKSYLLHVLAEELRSGWDVHVIDPKGESHALLAMHAAWHHIFIPSRELQALHASMFFVNDVQRHSLTPANLYALPGDMAPEVLAQIRAATTMEAFGGEWSELMAYGVEVLVRIVIDLGTIGLTMDLVRAILFDRVFREGVLLPRLRSAHLRGSVQALEMTLPELTRQAILRRFEVLLSSRTARVIYGLSPAAHRVLLPTEHRADIRLENFGPSVLRPPHVAIAQAMNGVIDAISAVMMREEATPELLLIIEEAAQLVHNPTVARYLIDASRTLRWRGLNTIICAQDPTNAFPREVLRTLALNARWFAAFQCAREDIALLEPYLPTESYTMRLNFALSGASYDIDKEAVIRRILTLPRQHFVLYLKGQSQFIVKTRTVEDPMKWTNMSREDLLAIFYSEIASRSMAQYDDAERLIEEETRALLGAATPTVAVTEGAPAPCLSVDDLFQKIEAARARQRDGGA